MADVPFISVALCTYNGEEFLKEQLDSLLAQSYKNIEIVAVDDCSSDHTVSILKSYAKDPRIRIIENQQNLGYNKNFAKALSLCSGEFIAICDQDDIWHHDKLSLQLAGIKNHDLIYHDSEFINRNGESLNLKISDKFNFYRGSNPLVFIYLNCVSGHSILMKKSLLKDALPFPEGFHYDQWLAFLAASKSSVHFIDQCLVRYRQHERNSTDILAQKTNRSDRSVNRKIQELTNESDWLKICAARLESSPKNTLSELYNLSIKRNKSFASPAYGFKIWANRDSLLYLLKKNTVSKFFYTLRKIWGSSSKQIFGKTEKTGK